MTDLERFEQSAVPRNDLVRKYAGRIEPNWGFVLYGILYAFVSMAAMLLGMLLGIAIGKGVGLADGSTGLAVLAFGLAAPATVLSWWPFFRWARRKRGHASGLVREGTLIQGKVATRTSDRVARAAIKLAARLGGGHMGNVKWCRVEFEVDGTQQALLCPFVKHPEQGALATVLYHPDSKYAFGFDESGRAYVSGLH